MKLNQILLASLVLGAAQLTLTPSLEARPAPPVVHHHRKIPQDVIELEQTADRLSKTYRNEIDRRPGRPSKHALELSRTLNSLDERASTLVRQIRDNENPKRVDKTVSDLKSLIARAQAQSRDLHMSNKTRASIKHAARLINGLEKNKKQWFLPHPPIPGPKGKR